MKKGTDTTVDAGGFSQILEGMNLSGLFGGNPTEAKAENDDQEVIHRLDISLIDEDPEQPRTQSFDDKEIEGMANGFKQYGHMSPISVRDHPDKPGRYIINYGARRLRAAKLANFSTIRALIENDQSHLRIRQVVENLARSNLSALEIATFIQKQIEAGKKKGEIANLLGKEPSFVSRHLSLIDPPPSISKLIQHGDIDATLIYELRNLREKHPEAVDHWLEDMGSEALGQEITRAAVRRLDRQLQESAGDSALENVIDPLIQERNARKLQGIERRENTLLAQHKASADPLPASDKGRDVPEKDARAPSHREAGRDEEAVSRHVPALHSSDGVDQANEGDDDEGGLSSETVEVDDASGKRLSAVPAQRQPVLTVIHRGKHARLLLDRQPSMPTKGWIENDEGEEIEVDLIAITLVEIGFSEEG